MKLLTKDIRKTLPPLFAQEGSGADAIVYVKFFDPLSNWTWYATEFDGDNEFFGIVVGHEREYGSFFLSELQTIRYPDGKPRIERDLYFSPCKVGDCK
jgi:hypothetical protein